MSIPSPVDVIKNHLRGINLTATQANELHEAIAICTRDVENIESTPPRWIQLPAYKDLPMVRIERKRGSGAIKLWFDDIEFPWSFVSVQIVKIAYAEIPSILLEISPRSITHNDQMLLPKSTEDES